jgi:outer membrane immunogenic protein
MKKILLSSVALLGLTAGALAADLPSRRMAPAPYVAVPVFTWTGFYVGVNAGYGFNSNDDDTVTFPAGTFGAGATTITSSSNNDGGFVGGGQVGYNYQIGQFVVGVEADIQYADLGNNNNNTFVVTTGPGPAAPGFVFANTRNGIDWFGTVRARLGFAFDRALIYATGGFAYGGGDNNNSCGFAFGCTNNDDIRGGYTVGGGIEYAFTNNLTAKLEGLYVNLDRSNNSTTFVGTTAGGVAFFTPAGTFVGGGNRDTEFGVVRVGLNYKFW